MRLFFGHCHGVLGLGQPYLFAGFQEELQVCAHPQGWVLGHAIDEFVERPPSVFDESGTEAELFHGTFFRDGRDDDSNVFLRQSTAEPFEVAVPPYDGALVVFVLAQVGLGRDTVRDVRVDPFTLFDRIRDGHFELTIFRRFAVFDAWWWNVDLFSTWSVCDHLFRFKIRALTFHDFVSFAFPLVGIPSVPTSDSFHVSSSLRLPAEFSTHTSSGGSPAPLLRFPHFLLALCATHLFREGVHVRGWLSPTAFFRLVMVRPRLSQPSCPSRIR